MLREFMAILDATTQEIVSMARSVIVGGAVAAAAGVSAQGDPAIALLPTSQRS